RRPDYGRCGEADGQLSDLKLRFLDLFRQLNTPDCNCRHVESFESKHRSNALLQTAMILLHHVVQVFTGPNPDPRHMRPVDFSSRIARCEAAYPSRVITRGVHCVGWPG